MVFSVKTKFVGSLKDLAIRKAAIRAAYNTREYLQAESKRALRLRAVYGDFKLTNKRLVYKSDEVSATAVLREGRASLLKHVVGKVKRGLYVNLKPGQVTLHRKAFIMETKSGPRYAVRLRPGQRLPGRKKPRYANQRGLLVGGFYGPTQVQGFLPRYTDPTKGTAYELMPKFQGHFVREYVRLLRVFK